CRTCRLHFYLDHHVVHPFPTRRSSDLGLLANIDYKLPFWFAGTLGIISMIAMYFMLPKKLEQQNLAEYEVDVQDNLEQHDNMMQDRKSTRLNSSHVSSSYAVFCIKKKT